MSQPTDLADRYGAPSPRARGVLVGVVVVVAAALLGCTTADQHRAR